MLLRDISFEDPLENIVFDEVLLRLAEEEKDLEVFRLWESEVTFVVLGRVSKMEEDVEIERVKKDNIPVLRRCSGGGTVLQGPGCLNYTLILSKDKHPVVKDLRRSYEFILNRIVKVLSPPGIESMVLPISDIALKDNQKKFSGNAQKRGKNFILHHGTILYNFDLNGMGRYLKMPNAVPAYRQGRAHDEFVTNIRLSRHNLREAFKQIFPIERENNDISLDEKKLLNDFLNQRRKV